jgi:hypothetical protein
MGELSMGVLTGDELAMVGKAVPPSLRREGTRRSERASMLALVLVDRPSDDVERPKWTRHGRVKRCQQ